MMHQPSERRETSRAMPATLVRPAVERVIVGSYQEMPGLSLHLRQAARLFALHVSTCEFVMNDLVERGILRQRADGQYMLAEGGGL